MTAAWICEARSAVCEAEVREAMEEETEEAEEVDVESRSRETERLEENRQHIGRKSRAVIVRRHKGQQGYDLCIRSSGLRIILPIPTRLHCRRFFLLEESNELSSLHRKKEHLEQRLGWVSFTGTIFNFHCNRTSSGLADGIANAVRFEDRSLLSRRIATGTRATRATTTTSGLAASGFLSLRFGRHQARGTK